ncbi:MAG: hypothetical protein QM753_03215 [Thermomicrobiales bacterium]
MFSLPSFTDQRAALGPLSFTVGTRPAEFFVVGERRDDPMHLLLRDPDGVFYGCLLPDGEPTPVEPDDTWRLEPQALETSIL